MRAWRLSWPTCVGLPPSWHRPRPTVQTHARFAQSSCDWKRPSGTVRGTRAARGARSESSMSTSCAPRSAAEPWSRSCASTTRCSRSHLSTDEPRLFELGSYPDAMRELESLRFSLHRLARRHGSATSLAAARAGLSHAAESLDALLMRPVLNVIGDRELVLVPTGMLHALPWPTLPSLRGRPVSVAPSATTWLAAMRATARKRTDHRVVLVAGPNLEHAEPEVVAVSALYGSPYVLTGPAATADVVRQMMDGAQLVHIAAHGRFRADNPQFSAIDLADGPLTVYDLERVRRGPRQLVLSACDSGLSAVHAGDELMGLAGAVFSLGTSTLIASVVPVADDLTKALMVELHRELSAGATPASRTSSSARAGACRRFRLLRRCIASVSAGSDRASYRRRSSLTTNPHTEPASASLRGSSRTPCVPH